MSGGIEMVRICDGGGEIGIQQSCSEVGGTLKDEAELFTTSANKEPNASATLSSTNLPVINNNSLGIRGVEENPPSNNCTNTTKCNNKKQNHRKLRRQHLQAHRKQQNHHYQNSRRIRRNTQPAPNNTNEFLMQEHDHLFHLDFENEDWEGQQHCHDVGHGTDDLLDLNNPSAPPHSLRLLHHSQHASTSGTGAFYSSSDDDQDYLSRDFSATYDTVNAERLSLMTKAELITEYQMLQERVETLERRLKTATASGYNNNNSSKNEEQSMTGSMETEPPTVTTTPT